VGYGDKPWTLEIRFAGDIDAAGFCNTFSLAHWFAQARLKLNGYEVES
jgi:acyl-CoA thioesterase FadM